MQSDKKQSHQALFIEALKNAVPANLNLADEISHELNISADSAYRRLRCETEFTYSETIILCRHFDVPFESLVSSSSEAVTFLTNKMGSDMGSFTRYLEGLYRDLSWLSQFEEAEIIYAAEDLPVFYSLLYPALARFKMCYWTKSILNAPEMQKMKIEDVSLPVNWHETAGKINQLFLKVKSVEIWNSDTMKSTLEQFRFYWESGFFRQKETALELLDELQLMVNNIEFQAESGNKVNSATAQNAQGEYILYSSDLMIGNNHVQIRGDNKVATYIGYNTFNYMRTSNRYFNEQVEMWQKNLIGKSTLLTLVSEKQRNQFFKSIQTQILLLRQRVEQD